MGTLQNMGTLRFAHPTNVPIHGGMMSGRYKAYAEYKDSGVEWLGVIPTHWIVSKIKFIAPYQVGWTPPTKDDANFEGENLWANISDLRGKVIFDTAKKISDEAAKAASMDITPMGSLLYSFKLSVGAVSFAGKDMYTNEAIASFLEGATLPLSYLYYVLPKFVIENASTNIYGARILNQELISNAMMLAPTSLEAEKIANFLDHETAKIDALIDKQQQLIKLLKEKRQAVISHAVTKGLNPATPMRDSGVEWLGEVPAHWSAGRLAYQIDLLVDGTHHSPESYPEGDYLYITAKNIKEHGFDFSNISYISSSDHDEIYSRCSVRKDDVLYIKDGATAGIAMVNDREEEFSLLSSVALIRPRKNILRPKYLKHHLNASVFKDEMLNRLSGGAMTRFTIDGISRFNILIPPIEEQDEIVELIEAKTSQMDILIEKAEKAINFMQERRTALISAAVTGKIDVRNWQAPASFRNHKEAAA
jgi:type I restriction enzyme S subunit